MALPIAQLTPEEQDDTVVRFSPRAYGQLKTMAQNKHKSVQDTVRDALSLVAWLDDALAEGGRLVVERPDGTREILTPRR